MIPLYLIFVSLHLTGIYATYYGPHDWQPDVVPEQSGELGENGEIKCNLKGPDAGKPNITWIFGNQTQINRTANKYYLYENTLTIYDLEASDSGKYACVVEDYPYKTFFYITYTVIFGEFCDFEDDSCDWRPDEDQNSFWGRETPKYSGMNAVDHTTRSTSGTFLNLGMQGEQKLPGDKAVFKSKIFKPYPSTCMSFFYFIKSAFPMRLSIVLITPALNQSSVLWTIEKTSEDSQWLRGSVPIPDSGEDYYVQIEGSYWPFEGQYDGNIGVDDIAIEPIYDCFVFPHEASPNYPSGDDSTSFCDFNGGACSWLDDLNQTVLWETRIPDNSASKSIDFDHTTGSMNGVFKYLASDTPHNEGDKAVIFSDTLPPSPSYCLSFWYFFDNQHPVKLDVVVITPSLNKSKVMWTLDRGQDELRWAQAMVPISNDGEDYYIQLEGTYLNGMTGPYGGIGVDDILIKHIDACYLTPWTANPDAENLPREGDIPEHDAMEPEITPWTANPESENLPGEGDIPEHDAIEPKTGVSPADVQLNDSSNSYTINIDASNKTGPIILNFTVKINV